MREFAGFATDAETARGWWIESQGLYRRRSGTDRGATLLTLAYGRSSWEVGGNLGYGFDEDGGDGLTDLQLWAKALPFTIDNAKLGGGLLASLPTDTGPFRGSGEWDFAPFVTGALPAGRVSLRASLGYVFVDGFFYDIAALLPIGKRSVFRVELPGDFNNDFDGHNVSLLPGFDWSFPIGSWDLLLRIVGGAELTEITRNYTAGISFAFTPATDRNQD